MRKLQFEQAIISERGIKSRALAPAPASAQLRSLPRPLAYGDYDIRARPPNRWIAQVKDRIHAKIFELY